MVETAVRLATIYHADVQKAATAAWLHDIAKTFTLADLQHRYPSIITPSLIKLYTTFPPIGHAFSCPGIIRTDFHIHDTAILNAVKWHTTGRANMRLLEAIIFVADFIEPGRTHQHIEFIRDIAYSDLVQSILAISEAILIYLTGQTIPIHPNVILCRNYYLKLYGHNDAKTLFSKLKIKTDY